MPYYPHHSKNKLPGSDGITKTCRKCLERISVDNFHRNKHTSDGLQANCKACSKATTYAYRTTDKGLIRTVTARHKHALKRYSLTEAQYDDLLAAQNYVCAICARPERLRRNGAFRRLAVDHCHETAKIRGLLCSHCNQGIGRFDDNPTLLLAAIAYLQAPDLSLTSSSAVVT